MELSSTLLASLSAWGIALLPRRGRSLHARAAGPGPQQSGPERPTRVRSHDAAPVPGSLFLPAGVGPHPALVLDAGAAGVNLRAEAHRFASIGIAAFFVESDDPGATGAPPDLGTRAEVLRDRVDIDPYEVGAFWIGRQPEDSWLDQAARAQSAFVVRVLLRPGMSGMAREASAPGDVALLDVLAGLTPLEPAVTRLVDDWLLRQVTIRA